MSQQPENGILYRLDSHRERIRALEERTANVNVHEQEIKNLWRSLNGLSGEIDKLSGKVDSLNKTLIGAIISFAIGSAGLIVTLIQLFG